MRILQGFLGVCLLVSASLSADDLSERAEAVFAGGCFWCMEPPFDKLDGVHATTSGYIGGGADTATYEQVSAGETRHVEAVKVEYDPSKVNYASLLEVFWKNIDPFDFAGQFCDKGSQYKSYIYVASAQERTLAEASLNKVQAAFEQPVATQVVTASAFYPAEAYHQDYYQRNPIRYKFYRNGCGRDRRLEQIWGD